MPGIHHVMGRTIKDIFCRFKTLQGFQVHRKAGWDTHGLPVELGVEKELGITKEDIGENISIAEYNQKCRENVMKFKGVWENLTDQMGYWVDMNDPYVTYDNKYIESVWWLLSQMNKKNALQGAYHPTILTKSRDRIKFSRTKPAWLLPRCKRCNCCNSIQSGKEREF